MEKVNIDLHVESTSPSDHTVSPDKDAVKQMEMQLHEQFAQNYNDTFGAVATLFAAMIAVLYGYGFIFLNSTFEFSNMSGQFYYNDGKGSWYAADALAFVTMASVVVLTIMQLVCIYLGTNQRKEQFIIHAIRKKYYGTSPTTITNPKIFPSNYTPFGKDRDDFIVGIYGELLKILSMLQWGVFIFALAKLMYGECVQCNALGFFEILLMIGVFAGSIYYSQYRKKDAYDSYIRRSNEFSMDENQSQNK